MIDKLIGGVLPFLPAQSDSGDSGLPGEGSFEFLRLRFLEDALLWVLDRLHFDLLLTYGWAIVMLTVLVRIVLLPLWIRQYKGMRRMRLATPEIKRIREKYKGDKTRMNEEMMRVYKEYKFNPAASCLPLLPQLPIFFALFWLLRNLQADIAAKDPDADLSFMWVIDDITAPVSSMGLGAVVLAAVYGISQLISTELSTGPEQQPAVKRAMRLLPAMIVVSLFLFDWPAGLVLYWASTNLWTAGQSMIFRKRLRLHMPTDEDYARIGKTRDEALAGDGDEDEEPPEEDEAAATPARKAPPRRRGMRRRGRPAEAPDLAPVPEPVEAPVAAEAPEPDAVADADTGVDSAEATPDAEAEPEPVTSSEDATGAAGEEPVTAGGSGRRRAPRQAGRPAPGKGRRQPKGKGKAKRGGRRPPKKG